MARLALALAALAVSGTLASTLRSNRALGEAVDGTTALAADHAMQPATGGRVAKKYSTNFKPMTVFDNSMRGATRFAEEVALVQVGEAAVQPAATSAAPAPTSAVPAATSAVPAATSAAPAATSAAPSATRSPVSASATRSPVSPSRSPIPPSASPTASTSRKPSASPLPRYLSMTLSAFTFADRSDALPAPDTLKLPAEIAPVKVADPAAPVPAVPSGITMVVTGAAITPDVAALVSLYSACRAGRILNPATLTPAACTVTATSFRLVTSVTGADGKTATESYVELPDMRVASVLACVNDGSAPVHKGCEEFTVKDATTGAVSYQAYKFNFAY